MKKRIKLGAVLLTMAFFGSIACAHADEVTTGLGAAVTPDYEGSEDYQIVPAIYARANWDSGRYLQFIGTELLFNALPSKTWRFGPTLHYRFERDDVDNDRVDRMEEVDGAFEAGAFAGVKIEKWHAFLNFLHDISSSHDGFVLNLVAGYNITVTPEFRMSIDAIATYASDDYMDTYFGVNSADAARSGLSQYEAEADLKDVGASVFGVYKPWRDWSLMGFLVFQRLLGDAADSPLVDKEGNANQFVGGFTVNYHFN